MKKTAKEDDRKKGFYCLYFFYKKKTEFYLANYFPISIFSDKVKMAGCSSDDRVLFVLTRVYFDRKFLKSNNTG